MASTKRLACPFCDAKLRIADTLPAGKIIKCPKCGKGFPVPDDSEPKAAAASPTYAFTEHEEDGKAKAVRKVAPKPKKNDQETEASPKPRKRRKKVEEATSNTPLILGLVIGGGVALIAGVVFVLVFRSGGKEGEKVTNSSPAGTAAAIASAPDAGRAASRRGPGRRGFGAEPAPDEQRPVTVPVSSEQASPGGGSDLIAAGQGVYDRNNCARCHAIAGAGMRGRGAKGPDLAGVGAKRTVDWLVEQIRDPQSHRPGARMPSYGDKISEEDLRALATYLASLK
jgi:mono/diheme cytochrome c family protein